MFIDKIQAKRYGGIFLGVGLIFVGVSIVKHFVNSFKSRFTWSEKSIITF